MAFRKDIALKLHVLQAIRNEKAMYGSDLPTVRRIQERKFLDAVRHAYQCIPFYKRHLDAHHVSINDIRGIQDLKKLPIVTKDDLTGCPPEDIRATDIPLQWLTRYGTSGSTGARRMLYWDLDAVADQITMSMPSFGTFYLRSPVKKVVCVVYMGDGTIPPIEKTGVDQSGARVYRASNVSFIHALEPYDRIVNFILAEKPQAMITYPGVIANVAEYALANGIRFHDIAGIVLSGEAPSWQTRKFIEEVFSTRTVSAYVTTEAGTIAIERDYEKKKGMKVHLWNSVVEILDEQGRDVPAGAMGSVVVTNLANRAAPIIRYSGLDDFAGFLEGTEYGTVLTAVEGRRIQSLVRRDGTKVNPYVIADVLEDLEDIVQYQVHQKDLGTIDVRTVFRKDRAEAEKQFIAHGAADIAARLSAIMGDGVIVRVTTEQKIQRMSNRYKTPLIVSDVV
jgi:phenylacetate-CoA ligase